MPLQNMQMDKARFSQEYSSYWKNDIMPQILEIPGWVDILDVQLYETDPITGEVIIGDNGLPVYIENAYEDWAEDMNGIISSNPDLFEAFHDSTQAHLNNIVGDFGYSFLEPGTQEFQDAFNEITSQTRYDENGDYLGGTKFYDKSQLYHLQTEYKFNIGETRFTIGANGRIYNPDSRGSIFNDGYVTNYNNRYLYDENGNPVIDIDTTIVNVSTNPFLPIFETVIDSTHIFVVDTTVTKLNITNKEFGVYTGIDRDFLSETLKLSATVRLDKNENFDYLFSPAASLVYLPTEKDVLRVSLSSAIQKPNTN